MPLDLQIIRASEFIRADAQGYIDMRTSRGFLAQLAGACRRRGINRALLDLRDLKPKPTPALTPSGLASLINTFGEVGFSRGDRLAVVYGTDPHYGARTFAFIGKLRGWSVQAFDTFEGALIWLSSPKRVKPKPIAAEARRGIPVEFAPEALPWAQYAHPTGPAKSPERSANLYLTL